MMMAKLNGCEFPDELYYLIEKHEWVRWMGEGLVRLGITTAGIQLAGGKLTAITVKQKLIGCVVESGKSIATIESNKFVGPFPAPVSGWLLRGNDRLVDEPNLAALDPYGSGWIAELQANAWQTDVLRLTHGAEGLALYKKSLDDGLISCVE